MGLFWVRPTRFINLDGKMRDFLGIELPKQGLSLCDQVVGFSLLCHETLQIRMQPEKACTVQPACWTLQTSQLARFN
jgi:hypothetical protein